MLFGNAEYNGSPALSLHDKFDGAQDCSIYSDLELCLANLYGHAQKIL